MTVCKNQRRQTDRSKAGKAYEMDIIIKKMDTDPEIRGKAYVHWKSWQETYPGIVDQIYLDELTLEQCETIAYHWTDNIIVAKDGARVVGFAGYGKYRNDELQNTGEVFAIYVLTEYHGQGVGYQLMQEALKQLVPYSQIAVWVLKDNKKAISFYKKCGYHFDGREETIHLGSPVLEVRMILER